MGLFFVILFIGLLYMQLIKNVTFSELSRKNSIRLLSQYGARGRILDRKGNILADNRLTYDVLLVPQDKELTDNILMVLSKILGKNFAELKTVFQRGYVASSLPVVIAKNIDTQKAIALEELKFNLPGIIIRQHPLRSYPYGKLACHVLGYLDEIDHWRLTRLTDYGYKTKDIVGFGGIEERYDYYLRQQEGGSIFEVDSHGRTRRILGFKLPKNGKDITLTLDIDIQKIAEDVLNGRKGCIVVMQPYTGEILAMASSPNFDPNIFVRKLDTVKEILNASEAPLVNRAISSSYPAGSIFKLIVATAALEISKISLSTNFFCLGHMDIGKQRFACWDTHHQENLIQAITHSCNVFFYKTGLALGPQEIYNYALKFGLSRKTSVDLPYETEGFVPSVLWKRLYKMRNWFDGDTANLAIGQGELLVTPLQLTCMMAVFANGGVLPKPFIVKMIDRKEIRYPQNKNIHLGIRQKTIDSIRQGLLQVVKDPTGTAHLLSELPVSVAGKTGTAQVKNDQPHAWFVFFLPFKEPKFVGCVFLENGGSGQFSCMLAKQMIERMLQEGLL
ncbi:MAG: penicillin-binding protein 2 [Candidatus Omnitrophica bacterium]|nr:penicillin-binding protein 2 [Candidatus Omnitrophota bacterium]